MDKKLGRRGFLKGSAAAGLATVIPTALNAKDKKIEVVEGKFGPIGESASFKYNSDGKFKILQITDTHYVSGNPKSERALQNVIEMLDTEKPDLVIHTGDVIYGKPAEESIREILAPISERKIPFFVAFGNHDEEFGKSRKEMLDIIMTIPYCLNTRKDEIAGATNDIITMKNKEGKVDRVIYIIDSNAYSKIEGIKGYDNIRFSQIGWYRENSEYFTAQNGGTPVPSFAFFHIPLVEHRDAVRDDKTSEHRGIRGELVASPIHSSGAFLSMREMGDIQACFMGHDHNSDSITLWYRMFFIYGRFSGCDTVYNDLFPNGARVIEITEGQKSFQTWLRLNGGAIDQTMTIPDSFLKRSAGQVRY